VHAGGKVIALAARTRRVPTPSGRQPEVDRLAALVRQAASGRGAAVVLDGEAGIGKTTLLDTVAAECGRLGVRVFRGGAAALEQRLPFAVIDGCLGITAGPHPDEVAAGCDRVAALLRDVDGYARSSAAKNHEFVVTDAILDLVDRWCARGPVALIIDDIQWADEASMVVLHRLGRSVAQQPLLIALATWSTAHDETANELVRGLLAHGGQALTLGPLADTAVAQLAADRFGVPAGPALLRVLAEAGGNPMYVGELLAALDREGAIRIAGGVADVGAGTGFPVPRSLVEAVQQRLDFLPRRVRQVLSTAAILGPAVDATELSMVLDLSVPALADAVADAVAAGLLVDTGQTLVFRHGLIREALTAHQPQSVRTALRLRAGQALAAAGAPVERVAGHLVAGTTLDRNLIDWVAASADALTVRAPELAVPLLRRALATAAGDRARMLRPHLVRALLWTGVFDQAEQVAQDALAAGAGTDAGALRWLLARTRYQQGRLTDVVATVEEALAAPDLTPAEAGRFRGLAALCLLALQEFDAAADSAHRAILAGEACGDSASVGYGYHVLAAHQLLLGDLERALSLVDRALVAFAPAVPPDLELDPHFVRSACLLGLDRSAEADEALADAVRHNQRAGGAHLARHYATRAWLRFLDGRWDDALAEIRTGLDVPDPYQLGAALAPVAALITIHRGDPQAHRPVPAPDDAGADQGYRYLALWAWALAEEARGNPAAALDLLYPVWLEPSPLQPRRTSHEICLDLARLAAVVGDRDRARHLAETTGELAATEPVDSLTGTTLVCQGLATEDPAALLAAADVFRRAGRPLHEGYAYENAAVLLAKRGKVTQARAALTRALALYAALDASWDSARAAARLRPFGVHAGNRRHQKRADHGWESLTATEVKVALLVAEGLSNPDVAAKLYLSRRTVQTHVSHILAKLGLRSRVELAVSASRRGDPAGGG
jgi:DNA-binding CsgD family transcriptional regulator